MIIDTHTHAWGPPTPDHPWVNESIVQSVDRFDVDTIYTAEDLLEDMDRHRIDEAVVVGYPIVEWTDNWYTLEAAAEHDRLYGVVMLDHFEDRAVEAARECLESQDVIGLRIAPGQAYDRMWRSGAGDPDVDWLSDAIEREAFWDVVRENDSVVTVSSDYDHLEGVRSLVERYPDITYLFDAYGPLRADSPDDHVETFLELAAFDSVGVKASHTPYMSNEPFPYRDVHDLACLLVDAFGRDRVAWGSDFPNVTQHPDSVTYAEAYNWIYHVEQLSQTDLAFLEGDAFERMAALDQE